MCRTCFLPVLKTNSFCYLFHAGDTISLFQSALTLFPSLPFFLNFSYTYGSLLLRLSHLSHPSSSHLAFFPPQLLLVSAHCHPITRTPIMPLPSCHIFSHFQMSETTSWYLSLYVSCFIVLIVNAVRAESMEIVKTFVTHCSTCTAVSWLAAANMAKALRKLFQDHSSNWIPKFYKKNIFFSTNCADYNHVSYLENHQHTHEGQDLSSIGWGLCMCSGLFTSVSRWLIQQRVCTSAIWILSACQTQLMSSYRTFPMSNLWKCPFQPSVFVCVCSPICTVSLHKPLISVD